MKKEVINHYRKPLEHIDSNDPLNSAKLRKSNDKHREATKEMPLSATIELIDNNANAIVAIANKSLHSLGSFLQQLNSEYQTLLSKLRETTGISPDAPSEHDTARLTQENAELEQTRESAKSALGSLAHTAQAEAEAHKVEQKSLSTELSHSKHDCKQQIDSLKQSRNKLRAVTGLHCDLLHIDIEPSPRENLFKTRLSKGEFSFCLTKAGNFYVYSPVIVTIPVDNILNCTENYSRSDLPMIFSRILKVTTVAKRC